MPVKVIAQNLDANESIFFANELTKKQAEIYEVEFPELQARSLIPISFDIGNAAEAGSYEQFEKTGKAKVVHNFAKDFPRVDVKGQEFVYPIKSLGDSYGYNIQEIRAAMMAGKPLEQMRAESAKRAIMQEENDIAFFGYADLGIKGFLSTDNSVPTGTVAADGAGASTLWDNKTPQQILRDMNAAASAIRENTKGVEFANTLLIPEHHYEIVANTPYSDVSERTILNWFLTNNIWVKQVVPVNELTAANNPFAKDLMVAYNKNPAKVRLNIPSDFEQFNPQEEGLEYVIYCQARCAGVQWYKPFSAIILDGI